MAQDYADQNPATFPLLNPAPVIELHDALGDKMFADLITAFEQCDVTTLAKIDAAVAEGDMASFQREVHGLKSAAASLGLMRLSAQCLRVEMDCRTGQEIDASTAVATIRESFRQSCQALRELRF